MVRSSGSGFGAAPGKGDFRVPLPTSSGAPSEPRGEHRGKQANFLCFEDEAFSTIVLVKPAGEKIAGEIVFLKKIADGKNKNADNCN